MKFGYDVMIGDRNKSSGTKLTIAREKKKNILRHGGMTIWSSGTRGPITIPSIETQAKSICPNVKCIDQNRTYYTLKMMLYCMARMVKVRD